MKSAVAVPSEALVLNRSRAADYLELTKPRITVLVLCTVAAGYSLAGGGRPDLPGAFVEPTLLADVTPDMRAYHEELFGPAAVVYKVRDADEAVQLANDTEFGLGATVFSGDVDKAREVAERIEAGMVWINQPTGSSPELPFGGVKRSGYGRELSELGMFEFANRRLVRTLPAKKTTKPNAG